MQYQLSKLTFCQFPNDKMKIGSTYYLPKLLAELINIDKGISTYRIVALQSPQSRLPSAVHSYLCLHFLWSKIGSGDPNGMLQTVKKY